VIFFILKGLLVEFFFIRNIIEVNRGDIMKVKLYLVILLILSGTGLISQTYTFTNYLPKVEKASDGLLVSVEVLKNSDNFYLYYRTSGVEGFQIRKMKSSEDGKVYYQLSTDNLYGNKIEYFILENRGSTKNSISPIFTIKDITEKESPEVYFQDTIQQAPTASAKKREPFYKFFRTNASLSTNTQMYVDKDSGEQKFSANGNLSFSKNIANEKFQLDFKSDFSYVDPVYNADKESKMNLTSMNLRFNKGGHTVEAGDLYVSNLDFTTSSINKRGFQYQFKGKNFILGTFYTNSQQKTKFEGFGIPPGGANFIGATAGFHLGDEYSPLLKVRGMFLTGRDNLDSKTVFSTDENKFSKGEILSFGSEFNLFKNHLKLKGEYVSSNFGKGIDEDSVSKTTDAAWFSRMDFNYGIIRADVDYREIGSDFSSIANLFFQNDTRGLASNIAMTIKTFTFHVGYTDQKKNLKNTELLPMLRSRYLKADFSWFIANRISIGAEYSLNNLDYDKSSGLQTGSNDMDTITYSGNIGYRAGNNGITLRLGKTESKNFTSNIDGSLAVNLQLGNVLRFDPSFTYQSTDNFSVDSNSKIYNLFINTELTFVPQLFSLSVTGSYRISENSAYDDETSIGGTANINFYMAKIFKNKFSPILILKSRYNERKFGDTTTSNLTIYLQADISF